MGVRGIRTSREGATRPEPIRRRGSGSLTTVITEDGRCRGVSTSPAESDRARGIEKGVPLHGEPLVHFDKSPGRVEIELKALDRLFDRDAPPTFPHAGPMLNKTLAKFMVDTVREDRRSRDVAVTVTFRSSPLRPEEEAGIRAQMSNFFANEAEMAALDRRVNSTEGLSSLRYSIPVVVVAAFFAGLLTNPSILGGPDYLTELSYLALIVTIWVMLWDPLEKLVFDSYFIRLRIYALQKLA